MNSLIGEMEHDFQSVSFTNLRKSVRNVEQTVLLANSTIFEFEETINEAKNQLDSYNIKQLFDDAIESIRNSLESRKFFFFLKKKKNNHYKNNNRNNKFI